MKPKILIVDDDSSIRQMLNAVLMDDGFEVEQADDGQVAVDVIGKQFYDLILMDIRMSRMGGIEALKHIKKISPGIPVIIMTAYASIETAKEALKSGAFDYLTKPLDIDELKIIVKRALRHYQLDQENRFLKERLDEQFDFKNIIGNSAAMQKLLGTVAIVAPTEATVLITGESGTGKEIIANAIHQNSPRQKKPMIKVNCAALPESLLESELFGHIKGAFTGATNRTQGRFQLAHQSTIFLDEISEMTPATQAKILRALQEKEIEPLGSDSTIKIDTRIVAATNKNLEAEIQKGLFREDLYYRLNVLTIEIPPIRKRMDDVPLLVDYFLKQYTKKNHKLIKGFSPKALDLLMRYDWPGNVREIENLVERSVIMTRNDLIRPNDFPAILTKTGIDPKKKETNLTFGRSLKDVEKEMILNTLEETGGNRTHTAKILGISRRTLQLKLKDYGIN